MSPGHTEGKLIAPFLGARYPTARPSPVLSRDVIFHISDSLLQTHANHTFANLASTDKFFQRELTPQLYHTVHLHSLSSIQAFFEYYEAYTLDKSSYAGGYEGDQNRYENRKHSLLGFMEHIDVKIPKTAWRTVHPWITKLHDKYTKGDKEVKQIYLFSIPVRTLYFSVEGGCPCITSAGPAYEVGTIEDLVHHAICAKWICIATTGETQRADSGVCGCRNGLKPKELMGYWAHSHEMQELEEHDGGTFGTKKKFLGDSTTVWAGPSINYCCLDLNKPSSFHMPQHLRRADRELYIVSPALHWKSPPEDYESMLFRLRYFQKNKQIRLLINKKPPFTSSVEWRKWIKEKDEWRKCAQGAWEDWSEDKKKIMEKKFEGGFEGATGRLELYTSSHLSNAFQNAFTMLGVFPLGSF